MAIHEGESCERVEGIGGEFYVQPVTVFGNSSSTSGGGEGGEGGFGGSEDI